MSTDESLTTPMVLPLLLERASRGAVEQALVLADALATGGVAPEWPPLIRRIYAAAAARAEQYPDVAQLLLHHPRLVGGLEGRRADLARAAAGCAQPWQKSASAEVLLRAAVHEPDLRAEARAALDGLDAWDRSAEMDALGLIALPEALRDAQLARTLREPLDPHAYAILVAQLPEPLARAVVERTLESMAGDPGLQFTLCAAQGLPLLRPPAREHWLPLIVQALCAELPGMQFAPWLALLLVSRIAPALTPERAVRVQAAVAGLEPEWRDRIAAASLARAEDESQPWLLLSPAQRQRLKAMAANRNASDALIAAIAERWTGAGPAAGAAPPFEDAEPRSAEPSPAASPAPPPAAPAPDVGAGAAPPPAPHRGVRRGVPRAVSAAPAEPPAAAPAATQRRIQARVGVLADGGWSELSAGVLAGTENEVEVSIGHRLPIRSDRPFREPEFPPGVDALDLELVFLTDGGEQRAPVRLPRDARRDSGSGTFRFTPASEQERFRALVVVLHAGGILQAAELEAPVYADLSAARAGATSITLRVHPWTRALTGLEHRRAVDAGVLADGERAATLCATPGTGIRELAGVRESVTRLTDRLFDESVALATRGRDLEQDEALVLLRFLCVQGWLLYRALVEQRMPQLRDAERIQVVTLDPSAHLPLELVYDHGVIRDDAVLCPRWRESLEGANGCDECPNAARQRDGDICPRGFWALRKVIERQPCHETDPGTFEFFVQADPGERGRDTLAPLERAVWGTSEKVSDDEHAAVGRSVASVVARCAEARDWKDWVRQVREVAPTVMVALPHKEHLDALGVDALELGREHLRAGAVDTVHVHAPGADAPRPLLLLLGCRTAVGDAQPFQDFVSEFRGRGAAVVVGTIATILAEDAAVAAQRILEALAEPAAAGGRDVTLGEALLAVRRRLFARGMVIALALAAFGDGDWKLAVPAPARPAGAG